MVSQDTRGFQKRKARGRRLGWGEMGRGRGMFGVFADPKSLSPLISDGHSGQGPPSHEVMLVWGQYPGPHANHIREILLGTKWGRGWRERELRSAGVRGDFLEDGLQMLCDRRLLVEEEKETEKCRISAQLRKCCHGISEAQASASGRPELLSVFLLPRWKQPVTSLNHSSLICELET